MLFDDYIFYLIETHADVTEDADDVIMEKKAPLGECDRGHDYLLVKPCMLHFFL